jgi:hypothetical protein
VWINGTTNLGTPVHITRLTDASGHYEVLDLWPGTYTVTEQRLTGWKPMTLTVVGVTVVSKTDQNVTFLNTLVGRIQGQKFYDKDVNGVMNGDEPGLPNWCIKLEGYTDTGEYVKLWRKTNATGWYVFEEVRPGTYTITEIVKDGWTNTTAIPIPVDVSGATEYYNITVNIGNVRFGKIFGWKFLDTYSDVPPYYANGIWDSDETGLGNWKITLQGWSQTGVYENRVTFTDNIVKVGYYEFTKLLPGMYWVNESLMWGMYATTPISALVIIYAHPYGPFIYNITFGNLIPSPDPQLRFTLELGWNMWSCPMAAKDLNKNPLTAKTLLQIIGSKALVITKLDRTTGKYVSYVDYHDADFSILLGEGYYIYVSDFVDFTLKGDLKAMNTSQLTAGWNIIGSSTLKSILASDVLKMVKGGDAWVITYLDAETGRYYSYVKGDSAKYDFNVTPGRAYFLWVDVPCTISWPMA